MIIKTKNASDLWNLYFSNIEYFRNKMVPVRKYNDEQNTVLYLTMGYDELEMSPYLTLKNDTGFIGGYECDTFEDFEKYLTKYSNLNSTCVA